MADLTVERNNGSPSRSLIFRGHAALFKPDRFIAHPAAATAGHRPDFLRPAQETGSRLNPALFLAKISNDLPGRGPRPVAQRVPPARQTQPRAEQPKIACTSQRSMRLTRDFPFDTCPDTLPAVGVLLS